MSLLFLLFFILFVPIGIPILQVAMTDAILRSSRSLQLLIYQIYCHGFPKNLTTISYKWENAKGGTMEPSVNYSTGPIV